MTYRDEFDEPPRGGSGFLANIGPKAAFFIVLIALSFMVGVVWKLYVGASDSTPQSVPIVRADAEPFKVVPDEPGGMEIRHKDSTIFSTLNSKDDEDSKVENLLAEDDDEEPMPRSQLFAGLNTEKNPDVETSNDPTPLDKPVGNEAQQVNEEEAEPAPEPVVKKPEEPLFKVEEEIAEVAPPKKVEPAVEKVKTEPAPQPAAKPTLKPEPTIEPSSGPKAEAVKAPSGSGDYVIQLASIKDESRAETEWKKLQQKYGQLNGYSYRVEQADLGERGTFYRIQAGPLAKDEANAICSSIKRVTPSGCLVKRK